MPAPATIGLDEGEAVFASNWRVVPNAPVIERGRRSGDIATLTVFLRRFGCGSVTRVDLANAAGRRGARRRVCCSLA